MPDSDNTLTAARLLSEAWQSGRYVPDLPADCRPRDRAGGFAIQAHWPALLGDAIAGWKIAATSTAGQQHIRVSGPLAGPIFARHVFGDGAQISLARNRMRVAECEVVFRIGARLSPRGSAYVRDEVLEAVAGMHPGIEVPDSRFERFEQAGEAQLIADCACMNEMVVGASCTDEARLPSLPSLHVRARLGGGREHTGVGSNVLGGPVAALVWVVNELTSHGRSLEPGQFVTTGACVPPFPVVPGDTVDADFGWLGRIRVGFAEG